MAFVGDEGLRYIGAFLITFGAAWALTPVAGRLAHRRGFLDHPGGHSTHTAATPTLGGLAIAVALVAVGIWAGGADGQLVTVVAGGAAGAGGGRPGRPPGVFSPPPPPAPAPAPRAPLRGA